MPAALDEHKRGVASGNDYHVKRAEKMTNASRQFKRLDENIFELEQPEQYACLVVSFTSGGPGTSLEVSACKGDFLQPQHKARLFFDSVGFFDGPLGWQSANFRLGTADQKLELLKTLGMLPESAKLGDPDANLVEALELFLVTSTNYEIRILAGYSYVIGE